MVNEYSSLTLYSNTRSKHWHLLDYVIAKKNYQCVIPVVRVLKNADWAIDHSVAGSRIVFTLKKCMNPGQRIKGCIFI